MRSSDPICYGPKKTPPLAALWAAALLVAWLPTGCAGSPGSQSAGSPIGDTTAIGDVAAPGDGEAAGDAAAVGDTATTDQDSQDIPISGDAGPAADATTDATAGAITGSIHLGEYLTATFAAHRCQRQRPRRPITIPGGPPLAT